MTPRFAQHVDPIFMRVFDLCERIEARADPPAEKERPFIKADLRRAEGQLQSTGKEWELAKYALVSWIDEMLLKADWSGRASWRNELLEWEYFGTQVANTEFYVKAKEAAALPGAGDALETYYVCFKLGFRGLYRPEERSKEDHELLLANYEMPKAPEAWANEIADQIRQRRQDNREQEKAREDFKLDRTIDTARPLWGTGHLLWPWLVGLLLFGLCVVAYVKLP